MALGQVWVKSCPIEESQKLFGETFMIIVTNPEDEEDILFSAGPYTIQKDNMITHELLVADFHFPKYIDED